MSVDSALVTADDFEQIAVERDGLCELVWGEVRDMTRSGGMHGATCGRISRIVGNWADQSELGIVITNDAGILTTRNPDSVRGPDFYYAHWSTLPGAAPPKKWLTVPPELCVEVLSPTDRWKDMLEKVAEYLEFGVKEVWVADSEARQLHVYRADAAPRVLSGDDQLTTDVLPDFACRVGDFFQSSRRVKS